MVRRSIFVLCLVTLGSGFAAAQSRTVTNADLQKFKEQRLAAERGLKVYYAEYGMTEAEVAKREAEDKKAREELSARLRSERLEREWLEQERMERQQAPPQVNVYVPEQERTAPQFFQYGSPYFNPYYNYPYYNRFPRNRRYNTGPRYRATPMGIIIEN